MTEGAQMRLGYEISPVHPQRIVDGVLEVDWASGPRSWALWYRYLDAEGRRCHKPVAEFFDEVIANKACELLREAEARGRG